MQEPENLATAVAEPEKKPRPSKLRKAGAVATSALAFVAAGKAEAASQQQSAMLAPTAITSTELTAKKAEHGIRLRKIEELPGYGIKVSPETRKQLTASAIKIVKRTKGFEEPWQEGCTGTKVTIGGEVFITSAKHCFDDLGWPSLRPKAKEKAQAGENPAVNLAPSARYEYAVIDPGPKKRGWPTELPPVIAEIKDIVVDPSNKNDWALLKPDISKGGTGASIFNAIPAMDIMKMTQEPIPGQEVALYGMPQVTNHKPVAGTGRFISTTVNVGREGTVAWIAVKAKDQIHDPGLFAASGSSAGADGIIFSSYAWRSNFGYPDNNPRHWYEAPLKDALEFRSILEMYTGVNLKEVNTVMGFTVDSPNHWLKLKQGRNTIASATDRGGELEYPEKPSDPWKGLPEDDIPQKGGYDPESGNK